MFRAAFGSLMALILTVVQAAALDCAKETWEGVPVVHCSLDPATADLRLFHSNAQGQLYGQFERIDSALGERLIFAMNAGMYHQNRAPVGLYVENGQEAAPLITRDGPGNFGLLPNGVFCFGDGKAAVYETRAFARARPACRFATQSGPMLLLDGALHPRFLKNSDSLYTRNGVGVSRDGRRVVFAIADAPINFHSFARLFRDRLQIDDALYFDGNVSRLWMPDIGRKDFGFPMGPVVGVVGPDQ